MDRRHISRRIDNALFDDASPHVDRFGLLLLTVVATLVVLSLVDLDPPQHDAASDIGGVAVSLCISGMLVLAVRACGVARRWRRLADVVAALAVVGSILLVFSDPDGPADTTSRPSALWIVVAVTIPFAVIRRILRHPSVSLSTLLGALSAYGLIAFAFTFAFLTVNSLQGEQFFGRPEETTAFMYFSLASMTTLGYGDLVATTDMGRLLATSEAVIGQIFLVTLVAAFVGLYAQQGIRRGRDTTGGA